MFTLFMIAIRAIHHLEILLFLQLMDLPVNFLLKLVHVKVIKVITEEILQSLKGKKALYIALRFISSLQLSL